MLADTDLGLTLPLDASDCVRHVARSWPEFAIKTRYGIAGFAHNTPFGEPVPLDASVSGQPQSHAAWNEIISRDIRERLVARRAIELLDAAGC